MTIKDISTRGRVCGVAGMPRASPQESVETDENCETFESCVCTPEDQEKLATIDGASCEQEAPSQRDVTVRRRLVSLFSQTQLYTGFLKGVIYANGIAVLIADFYHFCYVGLLDGLSLVITVCSLFWEYMVSFLRTVAVCNAASRDFITMLCSTLLLVSCISNENNLLAVKLTPLVFGAIAGEMFLGSVFGLSRLNLFLLIVYIAYSALYDCAQQPFAMEMQWLALATVGLYDRVHGYIINAICDKDLYDFDKKRYSSKRKTTPKFTLVEVQEIICLKTLDFQRFWYHRCGAFGIPLAVVVHRTLNIELILLPLVCIICTNVLTVCDALLSRHNPLCGHFEGHWRFIVAYIMTVMMIVFAVPLATFAAILTIVGFDIVKAVYGTVGYFVLRSLVQPVKAAKITSLETGPTWFQTMICMLFAVFTMIFLDRETNLQSIVTKARNVVYSKPKPEKKREVKRRNSYSAWNGPLTRDVSYGDNVEAHSEDCPKIEMDSGESLCDYGLSSIQPNIVYTLRAGRLRKSMVFERDDSKLPEPMSYDEMKYTLEYIDNFQWGVSRDENDNFYFYKDVKTVFECGWRFAIPREQTLLGMEEMVRNRLTIPLSVPLYICDVYSEMGQRMPRNGLFVIQNRRVFILPTWRKIGGSDHLRGKAVSVMNLIYRTLAQDSEDVFISVASNYKFHVYREITDVVGFADAYEGCITAPHFSFSWKKKEEEETVTTFSKARDKVLDVLFRKGTTSHFCFHFMNLILGLITSCELENFMTRSINRSTLLVSFFTNVLEEDKVFRFLNWMHNLDVFPNMQAHDDSDEKKETKDDDVSTFTKFSKKLDAWFSDGENGDAVKGVFALAFFAPLFYDTVTDEAEFSQMMKKLSKDFHETKGFRDLISTLYTVGANCFGRAQTDESMREAQEMWSKCMSFPSVLITDSDPDVVEMFRECERAIKIHDLLAKTGDKRTMTIMSERAGRLRVIQNNVQAELDSRKMRRAPFVMVLYGQPGVGKSVCCQQLIEMYNQMKKVPHPKISTVLGTMKYADGITNSTTNVVFDDWALFKSADQKDKIESLELFWGLCQNVRTPLKKADVDSKGNVYGAANDVTLVTNFEPVFPEGVVVNDAAQERRADAMFEVRVSDKKPEWKGKKPSQIEMKPTDIICPALEFQMYYFHTPPNSATRQRVNLTDWLTKDQFLDLYIELRRKHERIQKSLMENTLSTKIEFCKCHGLPVGVCELPRSQKVDVPEAHAITTRTWSQVAVSVSTLYQGYGPWTRCFVDYAYEVYLHYVPVMDGAIAMLLLTIGVSDGYLKATLVPLALIALYSRYSIRTFGRKVDARLDAYKVNFTEVIVATTGSFFRKVKEYAPLILCFAGIWLCNSMIQKARQEKAMRKRMKLLSELELAWEAQFKKFDIVPLDKSVREEFRAHSLDLFAHVTNLIQNDGLQKERDVQEVPLAQKTTTISQLRDLVKNNLYSMEFETDGLICRGHCFFVRPGMAVINRHYVMKIPDGSFCNITLRTDKQFTGPFTVIVPKSAFFMPDGRDVAYFSAPIANVPSNLSHYFSDDPAILGKGQVIRRDPDSRNLRDFDVIIGSSGVYSIPEGKFVGLNYDLPKGSQPGYCGAVLIAQNSKGVAIRGIHAYGQIGNTSCGAAQVMHQDISGFEKFLAGIGIKSDFAPIFPSDKKAKMSKKSVAFMEGIQTSVVGTDDKISNPRSNFVVSSLKNDIEKIMDAPAFKIPAKLRKEKQQTSIAHALGSVAVYPPVSLTKAISDYVSVFPEIISQIKEQPGFRSRPLSLEEAVGGVEGNSTLAGINLNTSTGFPYNRKKKFFLARKPFEINYDVLKSVETVTQMCRDGVMPPEPFTASLKDELIKIEKADEPRQFYGSAIAPLLVSMQYLGPLQQVIRANPVLSESYSGVDPLNPSIVGELHKNFYRFPTNRTIAGDFKKMDKKLGPGLKIGVKNVYLKIAAMLGYTDDEIRITESILDSMVLPSILVNGTTLIAPNLNPSGSFITIEFNGIGISLDLRTFAEEEFGLLTQLEKEGRTFRDVAALLTMGDDHIGTISDEVPDGFDCHGYRDWNAKFLRDYTSPDKTSELKKWYDIDEVDFCQRVFTRIGDHYFLKYDWRKYVNPLCYDKIKESDEMRAIRRIGTVNSMRMEAIAWGPIEYAECMSKADALFEYFDLPPCPLEWHDYQKALDTIIKRGSRDSDLAKVEIETPIPVFEAHALEEEIESGTTTAQVDPITTAAEVSQEVEVHDPGQDPLDSLVTMTETTIDSVLQRRVHILELVTQDGKIDTLFNPLFLFLTHDSVAGKISGFTQIRGTLKLEVEISAAPGNYGLFKIAYYPSELASVADQHRYASYEARRMFISTLQGVDILVPHVSRAQLEIPLLTTHSAVSLVGLDGSSGSNVYIKDIIPIKHFQGGDVSLRVQVYASISNANLHGTSAFMEAHAEDKPRGTLSGIASNLATTMQMINGIGMKFKIPMQVVDAIGTAAGVAAMFGLSRPSDVEIGQYLPNEMGLMSLTNARLPLNPLGLDAKNQINFGPHLAGDKEDNLLLSNIITRTCYIGSFAWKATDARNTELGTLMINPMMGITDAKRKYLTPMAFVANCFDVWRGSIDVILTVCASSYHQGQVVAYYDPYTTAVGTDSFSQSVKTVIDLGMTQEVSFRVNWASPEFLKSVRPVRNLVELSNIRNVGVSDNGVVTFKVLSPLISNAEVTQDVHIAVSVRAAADMVFGVPRNPVEGARIIHPEIPDVAVETTPQAQGTPIPDRETKSDSCSHCNSKKTAIGRKICRVTCSAKETVGGVIDTVTLQGPAVIPFSTRTSGYYANDECVPESYDAHTSAPTSAPTSAGVSTSAPTEGEVLTMQPTRSLTNAPTDASTFAPTQGTTSAPTEGPTTAPVTPGCGLVDVNLLPLSYTHNNEIFFWVQTDQSDFSVTLLADCQEESVLLFTDTRRSVTDSANTIVGMAAYEFFSEGLPAAEKIYSCKITLPEVPIDVISLHAPSFITRSHLVTASPPPRENGTYETDQNGTYLLLGSGAIYNLDTNVGNTVCGNSATPFAVTYQGNLRYSGGSYYRDTVSRMVFLSGSTGIIDLRCAIPGTLKIYSIEFMAEHDNVFARNRRELQMETYETYEAHAEVETEAFTNVDANQPLRLNLLGEGVASLRVLLKRHSPLYTIRQGLSGEIPIYPASSRNWHSYILSVWYAMRGSYRVKLIVENVSTNPYSIVTFTHKIRGNTTTAQEILVVRDVAQMTLEIPFYGMTRFMSFRLMDSSINWVSTSSVRVSSHYSSGEDFDTVYYLGPAVLELDDE